jgi:hypothetical protein
MVLVMVMAPWLMYISTKEACMIESYVMWTKLKITTKTKHKYLLSKGYLTLNL